MRIHIEDLRFQCIVGILDFERVTEQEVIFNATIDYDYNEEFINYAFVVEFFKKEMINNKFLLLEDALSYFSLNLKKNFPLINILNLKITKPSILPDTMVSVSEYYKF